MEKGYEQRIRGVEELYNSDEHADCRSQGRKIEQRTGMRNFYKGVGTTRDLLSSPLTL